jgi:hypothetical protein
MKFKKFILFMYDTYYPAGGLGDVRDSFDTLDEAIKAAGARYYDFKEIVDRDTRETVWEKN